MGIYSTKYRFIFILLLAVYSYGNADFSEIRRFYPVPGTALDLASYFVFLTAVIWESNHLIGWLWNKKDLATKAFKAKVKVLLIFFGLSVLYTAVEAVASSFLLMRYVFHSPAENRAIVLKLSVTLGTRINLFLQVLNAIFFFFQQLRQEQREAHELRRVNAQAELQAIRNQVNPHFLFNNLNVLSSLVLQERPEAPRFIEAFASVYRRVLNAQQKELVSLSEELGLLDDYLFMLRQRFPESIHIQIDVAPAYHEWQIPPLALQMLIENAVKHNMAIKESPLHLEITTLEEDKLIVRNNIQPRTAVESSGSIGLTNIDQRYALLCDQHIHVDSNENLFCVTLPLLIPSK